MLLDSGDAKSVSYSYPGRVITVHAVAISSELSLEEVGGGNF